MGFASGRFEVAVVGSGKVNDGFLGSSSRELGRNYTVRAEPEVGWFFAGWSGSATSSRESLTFTMEEGLSLTARFIENPFVSRIGIYSGLVQAADPVSAASGLLKLKLGATGTFSGKLSIGGRSHSLKGRFPGEGFVTLSLPHQPTRLTVTLQLDISSGANQITGTVTDGVFVANLTAVQTLAPDALTPLAGRYTIALPANAEAVEESLPRGSGCATLSVSKSGQTKLIGFLADGQAFTQTGVVSNDGRLPVYVSLYGGGGSLVGDLIFRETADSHCDGVVAWSRSQTCQGLVSTPRRSPQRRASSVPAMSHTLDPPSWTFPRLLKIPSCNW